MRVELLTREYPPEVYGGAGVHVAELTKVLRAHIEVNVRAFGAPRSESRTFGYQVPSELTDANPALQALAVNLQMVAGIGQAEIVHSHTWYANYAGLVASKLMGIPHVITAHSLEPLRPWKREQLGGGYELSSWIEKTAYLDSKLIIAVSEAMRADILRCYPELPSEKIVTVHNGIDLEEFRKKPDASILNHLGIDDSARSVVFVGRVTRQKGLPYLLKAARSLPKDVQLVICAGAADTAEIQAEVSGLVQDLKVTRDKVLWIERSLSRTELVAVLSSATVFACPSIYEPLGIVNLEAMACGAAVVATATGGIPEVVEHGKTGLLVPIDQYQDGSGTPKDESRFVADFATALNDALEQGAELGFGINGRARVEEHFSWQSIAQQTIACYQRVSR